jgi:Zn-dependent protease/predicted transcriptional regulator
MRWSFGIGRLFGIRIELHVTFLIFIVWIAVAQGILGGEPGRALATVALMLLVFGCVLLHELGHALTARRYGIRTRDIILLPIGGVARLERMPEKPAQEILVAVAGPAVNVVIALVLAAVLVGLKVSMERLSFTGGLLESLLIVNVGIVVFNMIPAFPMDGGRVLRALLALRLPYVQATRVASFVGQGVAVLLGIGGLVSGNVMLVFVAMFVFLAASEERAIVQTRWSLSGLPVRAAMVSEFHVLDDSAPLQAALDLLMSGSQQDFPVLRGDQPVGLLSRSDLLGALRERGPTARVGEVLAAKQDFADPGEPLEDVLRRMRERNRSAFPVLHQGRLVGMVTLENVSELLMMQDALRRYERAT